MPLLTDFQNEALISFIKDEFIKRNTEGKYFEEHSIM